MKSLILLAAALSLPAMAAPLTTPITGAGGTTIGTATLTDAPGGVLLRVEASGLAPGWHAVHFHEKADCSDAAFKTAGAHVHGAGHADHAGAAAPTVHGLLNAQANDAGDLPNIHAGPDGKASAELFTTLVALRDGTPRPNLRDADGSAVIIHAKADDYTTQPIGGAGDRVACAVVR